MHKMLPYAVATLVRSFLVLWLLGSAGAYAQADAREQDRKQLRALLAEVEGAIATVDVDRFLKSVDPDATITWQNGEVSRGAAAIRAYHERMVGSSKPIVKKFSTKAALGAPAIFYGPDVAVAYGTSRDHYDLVAGLDFDLDANWSTTVYKRDGQWKVAALHFSTDLFDNALLERAHHFKWYFAGAGLLLGLILAWVIVGVKRRKV
jgi:uncharacterized protein (TIGR02246 family)